MIANRKEVASSERPDAIYGTYYESLKYACQNPQVFRGITMEEIDEGSGRAKRYMEALNF